MPGSYRREVLEGGGLYHGDTLTEDFDATLKTLKSGAIVQASSHARVYTEAPESWKDLNKQRLRWYRGNFMTMLKHRDVFVNPRFGFLHKLGFPFILISMVFIPFAGLLVIGSVVWTILAGDAMNMLALFAFFLWLQTALSVLAIYIDNEDPKLAAYAPFFVVGYKHFCDFVIIKSLFDVLSKRKMEWTRVTRVGIP